MSDKYSRLYRENLEPYQIDEATAGVTYIRYFSAASGVVKRITVANSVTTIEAAVGAWVDRATLTYLPINEIV